MTDPAVCFMALHPTLEKLAEMIRTAPCNRAGLAVMVAAFTFALVEEELDKAGSASSPAEVAAFIAREIGLDDGDLH